MLFKWVVNPERHGKGYLAIEHESDPGGGKDDGRLEQEAEHHGVLEKSRRAVAISHLNREVR